MAVKELYFTPQAIIHEQKADSAGMLTGYVTKFGAVSSDRGGYRERFASTAFANLDEPGASVKALLDHSDTYLGRTDNGSLKLYKDETGLRFSLDLPDTQAGRDVAALVARKDLAGMSFGYVPHEYELNGDRANPIRTHTSGELVEVSVVYDPAFDRTSVELHGEEQPDCELFSIGAADPKVLEEIHRPQREQEARARKVQIVKAKLNLKA